MPYKFCVIFFNFSVETNRGSRNWASSVIHSSEPKHFCSPSTGSMSLFGPPTSGRKGRCSESACALGTQIDPPKCSAKARRHLLLRLPARGNTARSVLWDNCLLNAIVANADPGRVGPWLLLFVWSSRSHVNGTPLRRVLQPRFLGDCSPSSRLV